MFALLWPREEGPEYKGKRLSEWVVYVRPASEPLDSPDRGVEAVRQIGTNALPFLLKWIRYKPPQWREKVGRILPDMNVHRALGAWMGFRALGPQAAGAIPELGRLLNDPAYAYLHTDIVYVLPHLGKDAFPLLLETLTNLQDPDRAVAALMIGNMHKLGTNCVPAVPVLLQYLSDSNDYVAECSARALGWLELEPDEVVPGLTNSLRDSRVRLRASAAHALGRFGGRGRGAVPGLMEALSDPAWAVRMEATNALRLIAPQMFEKSDVL